MDLLFFLFPLASSDLEETRNLVPYTESRKKIRLHHSVLLTNVSLMPNDMPIALGQPVFQLFP